CSELIVQMRVWGWGVCLCVGFCVSVGLFVRCHGMRGDMRVCVCVCVCVCDVTGRGVTRVSQATTVYIPKTRLEEGELHSALETERHKETGRGRLPFGLTHCICTQDNPLTLSKNTI